MTNAQELIDYLRTKPSDMRVMVYIPGGYDDDSRVTDIRLEYTVVKPVGSFGDDCNPSGDDCYPSPQNWCERDIGEDATGKICEVVIVLRDDNYA